MGVGSSCVVVSCLGGDGDRVPPTSIYMKIIELSDLI